ncbi:nucleic acid-binding, OB-fold protein [Tanacetum coccineum]|uniref:Nucleic acid-binding, OB-fold protein n=1 Tax=Tanacetum coccineum TaxID=301880 RepID=A0ABQ5HGZ0_9ASTR
MSASDLANKILHRIGNIIELTLWDEMAEHFAQADIEKMEQPVMISVSSCRVSKYRDYQLVATSATYYYLNPNIPEAEESRVLYRAQHQETPPIIICKFSYEDIEQEKLRDRFKLKALMDRIQTVISKAVVTQRDNYTCLDHGPQPGPFYRYKFKRYITDTSATALLTFFTPAADKITRHSCEELVETYKPADPRKIPSEILAMEGKRCFFQFHFNTLANIADFTLNDVFDINSQDQGTNSSAEERDKGCDHCNDLALPMKVLHPHFKTRIIDLKAKIKKYKSVQRRHFNDLMDRETICSEDIVMKRDSNDVRCGMGMLHGSLTSTSNFREKKKELYLLAVGYLRCHNHTFYRMKYTQSIPIRPVHISWDSILMMVSCLIVGAYTKWIGGALSGLSFLPSVIGILVSGISMSEDSAVAAALRTFVMICWVEERIVEGSIEGSVVHIQGVRTVIIRPSGAISSYGLGETQVLKLQAAPFTLRLSHGPLNTQGSEDYDQTEDYEDYVEARDYV